jgi:hypothetical protein
MATITWQQNDCRIIKLEADDIYIDDEGREHRGVDTRYLLITGPVHSHIDKYDGYKYDGADDCVSIRIPDDARYEDKITVLIASRPDLYEWANVIRRSLGCELSTSVIKGLVDALDRNKSKTTGCLLMTTEDLPVTPRYTHDYNGLWCF